MRASKWIRVRPLEVSDFTFIRRLASRQANFTVPPRYVLWLLKKTNSQSCLVAQHSRLGPVAYLLSIVVITQRRKVLHVWQLAASKSGMEAGGADALLLAVRSLVRRTHVQKICFTATAASAEFRAIRRYTYALFGVSPRSRRNVPASVSPNEREFIVKIK